LRMIFERSGMRFPLLRLDPAARDRSDRIRADLAGGSAADAVEDGPLAYPLTCCQTPRASARRERHHVVAANARVPGAAAASLPPQSRNRWHRRPRSSISGPRRTLPSALGLPRRSTQDHRGEQSCREIAARQRPHPAVIRAAYNEAARAFVACRSGRYPVPWPPADRSVFPHARAWPDSPRRPPGEGDQDVAGGRAQRAEPAMLTDRQPGAVRLILGWSMGPSPSVPEVGGWEAHSPRGISCGGGGISPRKIRQSSRNFSPRKASQVSPASGQAM
jgi:hypothetical protein